MTALPPSFDLLWNRNGEPALFPRHGKPLRPPFDSNRLPLATLPLTLEP